MKKLAKKPTRKRASKTIAPETVLVLRTCAADMTAYDGFKWPTSGPVEAPDWKPTKKCGNGLHGLLWGEGDGSLVNLAEDAKWLVVEVSAADVIDLGDKVKFPRGNVACCGTAFEATGYLAARAPGRAIVRGTATAGDKGTATAGDWGTATAGDKGTATAGDWGIATAGEGGTATAGDKGTATAGDWGTATAGGWGIATAGEGGTATAGKGGTATVGFRGTATAGDEGEIRIRWYDRNRYRCAVGYVGENGITAGVAYVVRSGKLVTKD